MRFLSGISSADDAKRVWHAICAEGKPVVTIGSLKYLSKVYGDSVVPAPLEILPAPSSIEDQTMQVGTFIDLLFKERVSEHYKFASFVKTDAKRVCYDVYVE